MGIESLHPRQTFGIDELGLLDTEPSRPIDVVVNLFADAIKATGAMFVVFDDRSASIFVRSSRGRLGLANGRLATGNYSSASALVREDMTSILIDDLAERHETEHALERLRFAGAGFAGAPVFGPHSEVVGVLAALTLKPRRWSPKDRETLRNHADLLSQYIMLRAALETIKLMARERRNVSAVLPSKN